MTTVSQDVKTVLGIENSKITEDDSLVHENFQKSAKFENGRYVVELIR